jgi:hypothetical protein
MDCVAAGPPVIESLTASIANAHSHLRDRAS